MRTVRLFLTKGIRTYSFYGILSFLLFATQQGVAQWANTSVSRMPLPVKTYFNKIPSNTLLPSCDTILGFTVISPSVGKMKISFNPIAVSNMTKDYYFGVYQNGEFVIFPFL